MGMVIHKSKKLDPSIKDKKELFLPMELVKIVAPYVIGVILVGYIVYRYFLAE